MHLPSRFTPFVIAVFCMFLFTSCALNKPPPLTFAEKLSPTSRVEISFNERQIPDQCRVFSHLIISIPAKLTEKEIKTGVEQFAMSHGADYLLVGMARESDSETESISFQTFGPVTPYSFKKRWAGWKFGFSEWNSGGPLVGYGYDNTSGDNAAFDVPVDVQAALLTCQLGPQKQ